MDNWVSIDIGDEVTIPIGIIVEKRIHKGKTQFRNPTIKSVCNPAYIALFPDSPKPRENK